MSKEETRYFWNKTGECFAGQVVGTDITDHFSDDFSDKGKVKEDSRLEEFIKLGHISDTKPESYEAAEDAELNKLRETVENQKAEIADLENEAGKVPGTVKKANAKIKKLEAKLKDMPEGVEESVKKIDDLEKQVIDLDVEKDNLANQVEELTKTIEELTKPDEGGK